MATSRISNTIKAPDGTAIAGVPVSVMLMPSAGFRISDFTEVARITTTTTNASGFWQLDLERNANITPSNSWYEVSEQVPNAAGGRRVWQIAVGASDQSLLASLVTPAEQQPTVVPAGTVYLDQAAADARYQALGGLSAATPSTIDPDDTGSAGVSSSASRADHQHQFTTAAPVALGLAGTSSEGIATTSARSDHVHAYNPPACRLTHSVAQNVPDTTVTILTFDTERFDTDNMHSAGSPTRITINTAGLYQITATVEYAPGTYEYASNGLLLNGTTLIAISDASNTGAIFGQSRTVTALWKCAAGDFVEVRLFQDNTAGATRAIQKSNAYSPEFSAVWVGVG